MWFVVVIAAPQSDDSSAMLWREFWVLPELFCVYIVLGCVFDL